MRFHVDLQGAAGVAGHDVVDDPVTAAAVRWLVPAEAKQARLAVGERAEGLLDHDGLRAAAADPALDHAVGMDEAARAGTSRGRSPDGDDGSQGERSSRALELEGAGKDRDRLGRHGLRAGAGPRA